MPFCATCSTAYTEGARFCSQCGARLPEVSDATATIHLPASITETGEIQSTPATPAGFDSLPSGSALLVVQRGPDAGSRFVLDKEIVAAGRHPESDIFLDDVTVSRRHVEFTREGASYAVVDSGSLNGTYVNRDRIDRVVLKDGDEVQIGKFRLVFYAGHSN